MEWIRQLRRQIRPSARTLQSALRWRRLAFDDAPPVFGNAKPKSGSHLLVQILSAFPRLMPCRYVEADPIRTITPSGSRRTGEEILADLHALRPGVIGWGYLDATPPNVAFLCAPGRVNYFIYRDPRDVLVSHVYFATDMHEEHGMHALYQSLPDFGARLKVAITGIEREGMKLVDVRRRYDAVLEWLTIPQVLCLRFEDLIQDREPTLGRMLDQFDKIGYRIAVPRSRALEILRESIQPSKSHTFRSGRAGGWREHFTPEHKRLFLDVAGDLLIRLGYEHDNDW
ncbi:MAG TPA: sulfotransferase domain-containing protein [Anaerolineales bacterium]|nr:sulfotransferase domain-containing protein [Anaerolineales bacterium]